MGLLLTSRSLIGTLDPTESAQAGAPARVAVDDVVLHIEGLSCRACAHRAERALLRVQGVLSARVSRSREIAEIAIDSRITSDRGVAEAMDRAGYSVRLAGAPPEASGWWSGARVALAVSFFVGLVAVGVSAHDGRPTVVWARMVLAAAVIAVGAGPMWTRVAAATRRGVLSRDTVVLVGALISFTASAVPAILGARPAPSLLVMLGFASDPWRGATLPGFEAAAAMVTFALLARAAAAAVRWRALGRMGAGASGRCARRVDATGEAHPTPIDALTLGDRVRVLEGELCPADIVLDDGARVAEPGGTPVDRPAGHVLVKGALVLSAAAVGRVVRLPDPALARACDAQARMALARLDDTLGGSSLDWSSVAARSLTVATVALAAFAVIAHGALGPGPASPAAWMAAAAVLVGASSAAFAIGAPAAKALAVARARAAGIVVKDAGAFEQLAAVDIACFEKAGTVTTGELRVTGLTWIAAAPDRNVLEGLLALERNAKHPAGRAIARYLAARGVVPSPLPAEGAIVEASDSVSGTVQGALLEIGSAMRLGRANGNGAVWFGKNGEPLGYFELADEIRSQAEPALRALSVRGVGSRLVGADSSSATVETAHRLGIPGTGGTGPAEKALVVRDLQHGGARVLYVGNGWSDGAGAAQADVAIAIAPGILPGAIPAPIVVTDPSIALLPWLLDVARETRSRVRCIFAIAVVYNALLVPAALVGLLSPLAAAGMAMAETLLVLIVATRPLVPEREADLGRPQSDVAECALGG